MPKEKIKIEEDTLIIKVDQHDYTKTDYRTTYFSGSKTDKFFTWMNREISKLTGKKV